MAAAVFGAAALFCLARVGPGWLAGGFAVLMAALTVRINGGTLTRIDTAVHGWLGDHRSRSWQADAGAVFGYLGQPVHFAVVVVFCGTLLSLHARSVMRGVVLVGAVGVGLVVENLLKATIGRTAEPLAHWAHGFPSGHVTVWGVFLGTVAVCLGIGRSPITRIALGILAAEGVVAVAFLAVYSGAHTVTDTLGGAVLSAALVAGGAAMVRAPLPRARVVRAARAAATVNTHTAPMRTEEFALSRGY